MDAYNLNTHNITKVSLIGFLPPFPHCYLIFRAALQAGPFACDLALTDFCVEGDIRFSNSDIFSKMALLLKNGTTRTK